MSLALLPGTSPIVLTQRWKKSRPPQLTLPVHQEKRCVFVPYVRANELLVSQLCHTLSFTQLSHTPSFTHNFVTHHLSFSRTIFHIQLCHTQLCFSSRSSTTSFVFPSFPVPAATFGAHYWKKLPCGVIQSSNSMLKSPQMTELRFTTACALGIR